MSDVEGHGGGAATWLSLAGERPSPIFARFGGIGLLRGEFLQRRHGRSMTDERTCRAIASYLADVCRAVSPQEVWYQTADLWSEAANTLEGNASPYFERNPMVGVRGIRRALLAPREFDNECRVLSDVGAAFANLRVMLPFVADADEFARTLHAMRSCGVGAPIGCLIQLPSAAVGAGDIVEAGADRLLIGMDDLSCLVTGTERGAASDQALHPAVWEVVDSVVEDAHRSRVLCGLAGSLSKEAIGRWVASGADYVSVHYSQARSLLMPTDVTWPDENLEEDVEVATRRAVERLRRDMVALSASHDRNAVRAGGGRAIHPHQHTTEGEYADGNVHPT